MRYTNLDSFAYHTVGSVFNHQRLYANNQVSQARGGPRPGYQRFNANKLLLRGRGRLRGKGGGGG